MRGKLVLVVAGLAVAVALAPAGPAAAQAVTTQTFTTSQSEFTPGVRNQGWWSPNATNEDHNASYVVGHVGDDVFRNFFTFDVSSACAASNVTLYLTRSVQTGPLTYEVFDVSTPAATLNANDGASGAIFNDLGTGTSFGSFPVAAGGEDDVLSFPLNAQGVAAFNAARGGLFSIGGSTPNVAGLGDHYLYGVSGGSGTQQLVISCLPATKDQCKNGGWRNFPGFKNEGDCVSFVATKGKHPPSDP
jgi:hypothetical protein